MKMIGCSVTSSSASGLRVTPIRLRLASAVLWRARRVMHERLAVSGLVAVGEAKKTSSRLGRCSESSVTRDAGLGQAVDGLGERLVAARRGR